MPDKDPLTSPISQEAFHQAMRLLGLDPDDNHRALTAVHIAEGRITATYTQTENTHAAGWTRSVDVLPVSAAPSKCPASIAAKDVMVAPPHPDLSLWCELQAGHAGRHHSAVPGGGWLDWPDTAARS